jgi:hypothetical protein
MGFTWFACNRQLPFCFCLILSLPFPFCSESVFVFCRVIITRRRTCIMQLGHVGQSSIQSLYGVHTETLNPTKQHASVYLRIPSAMVRRAKRGCSLRATSPLSVPCCGMRHADNMEVLHREAPVVWASYNTWGPDREGCLEHWPMRRTTYEAQLQGWV